MDLEQTNNEDQKVFQNLQNLVDIVTQEFDQATPLNPIIKSGSCELVFQNNIPEALLVQSRQNSRNEGGNDKENEDGFEDE